MLRARGLRTQRGRVIIHGYVEGILTHPGVTVLEVPEAGVRTLPGLPRAVDEIPLFSGAALTLGTPLAPYNDIRERLCRLFIARLEEISDSGEEENSNSGEAPMSSDLASMDHAEVHYFNRYFPIRDQVLTC